MSHGHLWGEDHRLSHRLLNSCIRYPFCLPCLFLTHSPRNLRRRDELKPAEIWILISKKQDLFSLSKAIYEDKIFLSSWESIWRKPLHWLRAEGKACIASSTFSVLWWQNCQGQRSSVKSVPMTADTVHILESYKTLPCKRVLHSCI